MSHPLGLAAVAVAAATLLAPAAQGQSAAASQPGNTPSSVTSSVTSSATSSATSSQPTTAGGPITAVPLAAGERLPLDGTLSHPAWQRAPVYRDFVEKAPTTGSAPLHETRVRVLFDTQALYVGIDAIDPDPAQIRAPLVRHDGVIRTQDFVVVYIDAIGSRQSAQFFRVNAAGSVADGMHTASDDSEDFAPDFDFDAATARTATGYTAVLRIPFASLRFASNKPASDALQPAPGIAQPWRIMVARRVPRAQFYLHSSVLIPRDAPSFIATLQPLLGVQLPAQHQFLSLRPSLTWRRQQAQPAGGPASSSQRLDATLDLKWRPLAELVLDATLNPDFSQVALDVPQLAGNTRFALSFPEKRPFFFESSDLLRSPTEALYSRSFTAPRWGLRSTWRSAQLAGSAYAIDDRGGGTTLLPGPYGTDGAEQPASRAVVARGRMDHGNLQWGGLASARRYAGERGDNSVLGPDVAWQISDAWRLRAQGLVSHTTAQPLAGQLQRGAATSGHLAHARLWYQTPNVEGDISLAETSAGYRNDGGFTVQNGVRRLAGRLGHGWHGLGPFNEFWLNVEGERVQDLRSGRTVSQDLSPGFWLTGAHNLEAWAYWHGFPLGGSGGGGGDGGGSGTGSNTGSTGSTTGLRTAADRPLLGEHYLKTGLIVSPASWAPLLNTELQIGRLADVAANRVRPGGKASLTLSTRPLPRLELEPSLFYAWLRPGGERVYAEAAHQVLARWHFSPQQTLRAIVQYTALDRRAEPARSSLPAVGAQHSAGTTGSLTWAWRQSAGTVLYLGAARSRSGVQAVSRSNELFIKLQVDADEVLRRF